jgi:sodium/potassium/calcium exchanger 6
MIPINDTTDLPLWLFLFGIGVLLSILLWGTTSPSRLPSYHAVFSLVAFFSAVAWLNILAGECVAILEALGIMLSISSSVLGATVLAIGDSANDLAADIAVARAGSPATAIAVCFGAPMMTDIIGLGVSLTLKTAQMYPHPFEFKLQTQNFITWGFLATSLISSGIAFPRFGYLPGWKYGAYLLALYFTFLVVTVSLEI